MAGHGLVHTYELAVPILLTVWLVEFGVTSATLGTVVAVGYGLFGVGALPAGILVDRFGSRVLIVACTLGMGLSFLLLAVLPGVAGITVALACWGIAATPGSTAKRRNDSPILRVHATMRTREPNRSTKIPAGSAPTPNRP